MPMWVRNSETGEEPTIEDLLGVEEILTPEWIDENRGEK